MGSKGIRTGLLLSLGTVYVGSALLTLSKSDRWWIRIMDHPRLQLVVLGSALFTALLFKRDKTPATWMGLGALGLALAVDAYRVLPYTRVWKVESAPSTGAPEQREEVRFFAANVLQRNNERESLLRQIDEQKPDVVFLTEVNGPWVKDLSVLEKEYPHTLKEPLGNTYGLIFYSRFPIRQGKVQYLVEEDVPSVHGWLVLPSGHEIEFFGLHPKPPIPKVKDTVERDGELMIVAKQVRDADHPVVVLGDLNDVAWSHTTRVFRRYSGLLDPRVGRGQFSTWPAGSKLFRFPIDHVFHSPSLELASIDVLEKFGSDHLPLVASFRLAPEKPATLPRATPGDARDAKESIDKARRAE